MRTFVQLKAKKFKERINKANCADATGSHTLPCTTMGKPKNPVSLLATP